MFFELAEVLYVVQFTSWTNEDYSETLQALQLAVYARRVASSLAMPLAKTEVLQSECQTGREHPFRRVFLRLVFVNDASVRFDREG